jgi:opacity protein-like surface antigen
MKNKMLTLLLSALLIGGSAFAQATIKPHVGVNFTDVSLSADNTSASGKAGVLAGLSVAFGKKFYIEPGLQYVAKSTTYTTTQAPNVEQDFSLKGFRIPVAVGLNLLGNEKSLVTLHGFGGLSAFFVTSDDYAFDINKTNWGVFAGAGVDIWKLFVDMSYEWSLSELSSNVNNIEVGKTRSLYINAGFRFNL